ncbi:MAG: hypothetical protein R3F37_09465 [Candidatus Competibacteraceae bacterium]
MTTHADFQLAQELGVHRDFPPCCYASMTLTPVTQGYMPYERLDRCCEDCWIRAECQPG